MLVKHFLCFQRSLRCVLQQDRPHWRPTLLKTIFDKNLYEEKRYSLFLYKKNSEGYYVNIRPQIEARSGTHVLHKHVAKSRNGYESNTTVLFIAHTCMHMRVCICKKRTTHLATIVQGVAGSSEAVGASLSR